MAGAQRCELLTGWKSVSNRRLNSVENGSGFTRSAMSYLHSGRGFCASEYRNLSAFLSTYMEPGAVRRAGGSVAGRGLAHPELPALGRGGRAGGGSGRVRALPEPARRSRLPELRDTGGGGRVGGRRRARGRRARARARPAARVRRAVLPVGGGR